MEFLHVASGRLVWRYPRQEDLVNERGYFTHGYDVLKEEDSIDGRDSLLIAVSGRYQAGGDGTVGYVQSQQFTFGR